ncbi:tetratricopeptide repeat protein [Nostoc sp. C117]|uniref:tetratricopeptide repeat protein n=1 Tax=Nostoc sp. C117 TaxID=3349875 RepID=UPI00370DD750
MGSLKILPLLLGLSLVLAPQITSAQTVEELEQKATSAEEVKNYEEAANIWRSLIERDRNNTYAYVKLADILSSQGKIADTIATYRQALQLAPDAEIYLKLANFLAEKGRITEAIASYRQSVKLDAKNDTAYTSLGNQLIAAGNTEEALVAYRQAVKLKPEAYNYNTLADTLLKTGKREEAIAAYRQVIKLDTSGYWSDNAYDKLGEILEYSEAVAIYRQASKNNPEDEAYYQKLGELSFKRGFVNEAIAAYRQLVKIKPEASAYVDLADVLIVQNKSEEAIGFYRQAVAKEPSDYYYNKLNEVLVQEKNLDEALAICQKIVRIGEGSYDSCSNVNLLLYKQKGFTGVMEFYQPLANLIPRRQMAELYIKLGKQIAYGESGDGSKQEATTVLREALKIDPENSDAQDALKDLIAN